jgi:hypothetical protein
MTGFGTSTPLGVLLLICGAVPLIATGYAAAGRALPVLLARHRLLMGCGVVALPTIVLLALGQTAQDINQATGGGT